MKKIFVGKNTGDIFEVSKAQLEENTELAAESLLVNRIALRGKGFQVEALQKRRNYQLQAEDNMHDFSNPTNNSGGDPGLESHPMLPYGGGKFNQVIFPENNLDAIPEDKISSQQKRDLAKKREKQRKDLSNRLKQRNSLKIAPKQAIKYVAPPPRNRPTPKPRPIGG